MQLKIGTSWETWLIEFKCRRDLMIPFP